MYNWNMKQLAIRKHAATLECIHNREHEIVWDEDTMVFVVDNGKVTDLANISQAAGEIVLYSPRFEFQCAYVGYRSDWNIFDAI